MAAIAFLLMFAPGMDIPQPKDGAAVWLIRGEDIFEARYIIVADQLAVEWSTDWCFAGGYASDLYPTRRDAVREVVRRLRRQAAAMERRAAALEKEIQD